MVGRVTLDKAGRMVLPKPIRDELQLSAGDALAAEVERGRIVLRPLRSTTALQKERGVWVYKTGRPLPASTADETLNDLRSDRERNALGKL